MATTVGGLGEREKRTLIVRYKSGDLVATLAEQADDVAGRTIAKSEPDHLRRVGR